MPWKETGPVEERKAFVEARMSGQWTMTDLCRKYGISRKNGYKWWNRFEVEGQAGLIDRSRAPKVQASETADVIVSAIVAARKAHPCWGAKKLVVWLAAQAPQIAWPVPSTVDAILKREGLVLPRKLRRRVAPSTQPFGACDSANALWGADFKGKFWTGDGKVCNPLTVSDGYSRLCLRCEALGAQTGFAVVWPIFDIVFCEFGLPDAIRTDNGPPFATLAPGGLSQLSIRLIKLGIRVERIEPGRPEQNGRHERLHLTLDEETLRPPCPNRETQQRRFDRWRREYNEERPHEALGQKPPLSVYQPSARRYPVKLAEPDYDDTYHVRRVKQRGSIKWNGNEIFVSEALRGEAVGLEPTADGKHRVWYGPVELGTIDQRGIKFERRQAKPRRRRPRQRHTLQGQSC